MRARSFSTAAASSTDGAGDGVDAVACSEPGDVGCCPGADGACPSNSDNAASTVKANGLQIGEWRDFEVFADNMMYPPNEVKRYVGVKGLSKVGM